MAARDGALASVSSPEPARLRAAAAAVAGLFAAALVYGLFTGAAMGVDFPRSDRRFARLA